VFSGKPSAINVACSVWEEGNEKGLKGTSSVPYFIRWGGHRNLDWQQSKALGPHPTFPT